MDPRVFVYERAREGEGERDGEKEQETHAHHHDKPCDWPTRGRRRVDPPSLTYTWAWAHWRWAQLTFGFGCGHCSIKTSDPPRSSRLVSGLPSSFPFTEHRVYPLRCGDIVKSKAIASFPRSVPRLLHQTSDLPLHSFSGHSLQL